MASPKKAKSPARPAAAGQEVVPDAWRHRAAHAGDVHYGQAEGVSARRAEVLAAAYAAQRAQGAAQPLRCDSKSGAAMSHNR